MAASVIGALRVNLGLDSAQFSRGIKKSESELSAFRGRIVKMAAGLGALFAGALTIRGAGNMADEWSDLSSQVGNTIGNMERAPEVMRQLSDMARQSYSDLGQTVGAFVANSTALKDLGYATRDQLSYTEALNNALVISGARGQKAASVQNALSRAMAVGKLSGDGLNSVLANGGRVAQALADELGTNVSGLRKLGAEGKITGSVIANAMLNSMEALRDEAGEMPATIADGLVLMRNAALEMVGTFDKILGVSGGVGTALVGIADAIRAAVRAISEHADLVTTALNTMLASAGIVAAFFAGRYAVSLGVTAVSAMVSAWRSSVALNLALGAQSLAAARAGAAIKLLTLAFRGLRAALISTGIGAAVVAAGYLIAKFIDLVKKTGSVGNALRLLKDVAVEVFDRIGDAFAVVPAAVEAGAETMKSVFLGALHDMLSNFSWFIASIARGMNEVLGTTISEAEPFQETIAGLSKASSDASDAAKAATNRMSEAWKGATAPLESLAGLNKAVADSASEAAGSLGGAGGGLAAAADGAGKKAKEAKEKLTPLQEVLKRLREESEKLKATLWMSDTEATVWENLREAKVAATSQSGKEIAALTRTNEGLKQLKESTDSWRDSLKSTFGDLVSGASSFKDALRSVLQQLAKMWADSAFMSLWGGTGMGKWFGGLLPKIGANANGTNDWRGGLTRINERGGEIVDLPSGTRIIPHDVSKRMVDDAAGGAGGGHMSIGFDRSVGDLTATMYDIAGNVVASERQNIVRDSVRSVGAMNKKTKSFLG
ncbi:tape measure protein [Paracoccus denitrificans]|uniref:tape measure protein n=1 Tax=Paracoccus denitrificans TaxID=266 RepID=UPI001E5A497E|nr:tape measure protein [Paracoccus denitrificans]UFS64398.1 tape measure protein [Paracoccus denitrificans]